MNTSFSSRTKGPARGRALLAAAFVAALLASSCTDTRLVPDEDAALTILPTGTAATKAAIDGTAFPENRTMAVSAFFNAPVGFGSSANYFGATTFAKDGDVWRSAADPKYWPTTGTIDIFAWSADGLTPSSRVYAAKYGDGLTMDIPDNADVQCDILAAGVRAVSKIPEGVPMAFRHAQALLCFVAESSVPYDAAANYGITITGITLKDTYFSGTLAMAASNDLLVEMTEGAAAEATADDGCFLWSALGSRGDKTLPTNAVAGVKLPYNVPATAMDFTSAGNRFGIGGVGILVPEQDQTSFVIAFTLHNGYDDSGTAIDNQLIYEYTCSGVWEEGKKYVYSLSFTMDEITVSPTVVDWTATPAVPVPVQ